MSVKLQIDSKLWSTFYSSKKERMCGFSRPNTDQMSVRYISAASCLTVMPNDRASAAIDEMILNTINPSLLKDWNSYGASAY